MMQSGSKMSSIPSSTPGSLRDAAKETIIIRKWFLPRPLLAEDNPVVYYKTPLSKIPVGRIIRYF